VASAAEDVLIGLLLRSARWRDIWHRFGRIPKRKFEFQNEMPLTNAIIEVPGGIFYGSEPARVQRLT